MQKEMYSGSKAYMEPVRFRRLYLRIMAEVEYYMFPFSFVYNYLKIEDFLLH